MLTFQDAYQKARFVSGQNDEATLTQLKQDINIGYKRFNAAIARYFTRKQQFTDIVADQQYYQVPVDSIRVSSITVTLPNGYIYPVKELRSEDEWRRYNITPYTSNYAMYYFVYGNDQLGLFPIPAEDVDQGLRFVYQPQDVDLTQDDYTTGTVVVTNDSVTVTGTSTTWTTNMIGRFFTVTDGSDGEWYEITAVPDATTLTLKTPVVGATGSGKAYRIGQTFIFPDEYDDVPIDYALYRFFESRNNADRAAYHKKNFDDTVEDAVRRYASSTSSNVITEDNEALNIWWLPPMPGSV